jgi:glycosyltransferase involved in cell wall biosynthesis
LNHGEQGNEDLRAKLGIDGVMALYVGNLEKYQGIDLLLDGFRQAVADQEGLNLVLIGGSPEHVEKYQKRVKQLNLESKVFFCGPRPVTMLGYYLAQADILVSPRTQGNNTPMKIYSYLDSGVPVLATDLPTHTQVLDERIACLTRPEPEALAKGLVALAGDEEKRRDIGVNARQRVHEEYSLPAYKRKLAAFYGQLAL